MRNLICLGLLVVCSGCPRADDAPSRPAASPADTPDTPAETTPPPAEDPLALEPEEALAGGLTGDGPEGLNPELAEHGAEALVAQLRAEGVELEELQGKRMHFEYAGARLDSGTKTFDEIQAQLSGRIEGASPRLERWLVALAGTCQTAADFKAAAAFLRHVETVWAE